MAESPDLANVDVAALDAAYQPPRPLADWLAATVVESLWNSWKESLDVRRKAVTAEQYGELRDRIMRQAAIETGSIEGLYQTERGFTRTTAAMATGWEAAVEAAKGTDVRRLIEGQMQAYEMALDVATRRREVSETLVRQLHELACAGQDTYVVFTAVGPQRHPLPKGAYKKSPNHVEQADGTTHSYAPVDRTPDEMRQLVENLRDPLFEAAHPAVQAAYAHHALVTIHPFSDGNGRVARLLASIYLLREASIPFLLFADERERYLDAIQASDRGAVGTFVRFVADRTVDTMMYLVEELRRCEEGDQSPLNTLSEAFRGPGGLLPREVDAMAERLRQAVREVLRRFVDGIGSDIVSSASLQSYHYGSRPVRDDLRQVVHGFSGMPRVELATYPPVEVKEFVDFDVLITKDASDPFPFKVEWVGNDEYLDVRFEEIYPAPTQRMLARLEAWLGRILDLTLRNFVAATKEALRAAGYQ